MEFLFSMLKFFVYWIFGAIYIGLVVGITWLFDNLFGDGAKTLTDFLISAAVLIVPFVVGKVLTSPDDF